MRRDLCAAASALEKCPVNNPEGALESKCPLPGRGCTALPLRLAAKQQVLKEEMASESGRGGERDAQDCRLTGYGKIAAG